MAPEILNPLSTQQKFDGVRYIVFVSGFRDSYYSLRADLWALGVTLYSFLVGTVPWNDITHVGIFSKIKSQPPNVDNIAATVSPQLIQLVLTMLEGLCESYNIFY